MTPDLSTTYLGLQLASPLVPSASPLSRSLDAIRRMEDGAGHPGIASSPRRDAGAVTAADCTTYRTRSADHGEGGARGA
jgi:dihydroorotate dehydrogenase (fumarate)